jgi:hypothetical protein
MTQKAIETNVTVKPTRTARKKVYERVRETAIPAGLEEIFKKDDYDLKLVRFLNNGNEDYRYLNRRLTEGYEFVTASEIPDEMKSGLDVIDTKAHSGLVTVGDLCLMKVDKDLRNSRRKFYQDETSRHIQAVNVLNKGFIDNGTSTRVLNREPTFQE